MPACGSSMSVSSVAMLHPSALARSLAASRAGLARCFDPVQRLRPRPRHRTSFREMQPAQGMQHVLSMRRLWIGLSLVLFISFGVLIWVGSRIYQLAPPIPDRVVTTDGRTIFGPGEVAAGQDVWRSFGGMEL